ncbi:MAG: DivIVA domain-containing protein [Actinobacteria bacterium]|nr:DivIVA domain-containing protein [Actinomycetota bacterium]
MALDRQSIQKRDFPIGRRGYEPAAVDAHLAVLAREVEALKRANASESAAPAEGRRSSESLASVASSQVQAIVEAAEASAHAIEREARDHAEQAAQEAARDAQRIRDEAIARAQEHVGKVHEATSLMLQRVDAMESELGALVESLRTGANRLNADLSLLSGNMGELYEAAGRSSSEAAGRAPIVVDVLIVEEVEVVADVAPPEPTPAAAPPDAAPAAAESTAPAGDDDEEDVEGARLIALNMALNGQSRAETDKYLAENFDLSDRAALLDEVYASVEG